MNDIIRTDEKPHLFKFLLAISTHFGDNRQILYGEASSEEYMSLKKGS